MSLVTSDYQSAHSSQLQDLVNSHYPARIQHYVHTCHSACNRHNFAHTHPSSNSLNSKHTLLSFCNTDLLTWHSSNRSLQLILWMVAQNLKPAAPRTVQSTFCRQYTMFTAARVHVMFSTAHMHTVAQVCTMFTSAWVRTCSPLHLHAPCSLLHCTLSTSIVLIAFYVQCCMLFS